MIGVSGDTVDFFFWIMYVPTKEPRLTLPQGIGEKENLVAQISLYGQTLE